MLGEAAELSSGHIPRVWRECDETSSEPAYGCALGCGHAGRRPRVGGRTLRGRLREHPHVHGPANRGAPAASRPGLREADGRQDQRHHRPLQRPLPEDAHRYGDEDEQLPRVRLRPPVAGGLRHAGIPRGPDESGRRRQGVAMAGYRPVLPQLHRDVRGTKLHGAAGRRVYVATGKYGPPDELNWDVGDSRSAFVTGRCALTVDWGDIGTLAIDPKTSKVMDKVGAVILPGTHRVLDRKTGKLVPCDRTTCPYGVHGVNHAPYAAFGGWSGGINAAAPPRVKDAAYAFLSYMSQPAQSNVDVTIGITGFNPYRTSQFKSLDLWLKAGMSRAAAQNYLGAIEASLNSPNMVLDLRIPQNQRYQQVVLDTAVAKLLARQTTIDQAVTEISEGWEAITNELGRDKQLKAYRETLNVQR